MSSWNWTKMTPSQMDKTEIMTWDSNRAYMSYIIYKNRCFCEIIFSRTIEKLCFFWKSFRTRIFCVIDGYGNLRAIRFGHFSSEQHNCIKTSEAYLHVSLLLKVKGSVMPFSRHLRFFLSCMYSTWSAYWNCGLWLLVRRIIGITQNNARSCQDTSFIRIHHYLGCFIQYHII